MSEKETHCDKSFIYLQFSPERKINPADFMKFLIYRLGLGHLLIDYVLDDGPAHYLVRFYKINIPFVSKNPWYHIKVYDNDLYSCLSTNALQEAIYNKIVRALSTDNHSL